MNEIKYAVMSSCTKGVPNDTLDGNQKELGVVLPVQTTQDFEKLEEALDSSEENRNILVRKT